MLEPSQLLPQKSKLQVSLLVELFSSLLVRLAQQCDTIITMLPSSPHVREVYLGSADAIIHGLRPATLCIDSSTIDPDTSRAVAAEIAKLKNGIMVDAPVSVGSVLFSPDPLVNSLFLERAVLVVQSKVR